MIRTPDEWRHIFSTAPTGIIPMDADGIVDTMESLRNLFTRLVGSCHEKRILDIGCGIGRLAASLITEHCRYDGIDVNPAAIRFCEQAFADFSNIRFRWLDVKSDLYHREGKIEAKNVVLPYDDQAFDIVAVFSVFTHMPDVEDVENYLREISRVLKPDGCVLSTWFRSPPNTVSAEDERVVFTEEQIRLFFQDFTIVHDEGGTTTQHHDQWITVATPQR